MSKNTSVRDPREIDPKDTSEFKNDFRSNSRNALQPRLGLTFRRRLPLTGSRRTLASAATLTQRTIHYSLFLLSLYCETPYVANTSQLVFDRQRHSRYFSNYFYFRRVALEMRGFEPLTLALQTRRSPAELHPRVGLPQAIVGRLPRQMGVLGFEPRTSALSELRSSQLSYTRDTHPQSVA